MRADPLCQLLTGAGDARVNKGDKQSHVFSPFSLNATPYTVSDDQLLRSVSNLKRASASKLLRGKRIQRRGGGVYHERKKHASW